jgi:ligand-binding sensor domain-containing protein
MKVFFCIIVLSIAPLSAQEWKYFTTANSGISSNLVYDLVIAPDHTVWAATGNGVVSYKIGTWTLYDTVNSSIPDPYCTTIAVDSAGTVWVGTGYAGAARFSGGVWTLFDTANSDIPHNTIFDITIGPDQSPWFATDDGVANLSGGVWKNKKQFMFESRSRSVRFDRRGVLWMGTYDPIDFRGYVEYMNGDSFSYTILSKQDLISTYAGEMVPMDDSTMAVGTGYGLAMVVNGKWTVYTKQNSPLPSGGVSALAVQGDTLLIGTSSGIAEKVNTAWSVQLPSAGGLPNDVVTAVAVDRYGNRWFATMSSGIVVYKKGGVVSAVAENRSHPEHFSLLQNFPNPFNPVTTLQFIIPDGASAQPVTLTIYDMLGRRVTELVNGIRESGVHTVQWNASDNSSGIYFAKLTAGSAAVHRKLLLLK